MMFRIAECRVTPILIEDPPLLNAQGVHQPYTPRTIVEVVTENGVVGLGETYGDAEYLTVAEAFAPRLAGAGLTVNDLGARVAACAAGAGVTGLDAAVNAGGLRGSRTLDKVAASVASGFEVAILDALGRELGVPVHQLLGGKVRDRVEYSAYLFYRWARHPGPGEPCDDWGAALDPEGVVAQARRMVERYGFTSFKLKGGVLPPFEEVDAVLALHDTFPGRPLRLDPNGAWSVPTSLAVAARLEGVAEYLEDPTSGTAGMAEVARGTSLPLATNMCVTGFAEIPEAFARNAVQVVLSDHHYWGGLRATQDLAAVCRTFGVGMSMHSNTHLGISLAAMTQVAATLPGLRYACDTHRPWQTEDVITRPHTFTDGALPVTDTPGLGVELDRDALARLHRRYTESDVRGRDDAAAMRRVHPDWRTPDLPRW
ncbi:glucarate dehydratase family protein [Streptomyces sp. SL13]|uniref:glucarate dehydratase n=1 Tax=Streptantibioticus silvisoli TaxID=2705255 RepID=A0AA90KHC0_9ACTN|nr:glucarate dehydratase family protein [Streptantibioticus silvisoli]MDI5971234.1 glucarate dehydratase family protein [Streptantibioticus silvisoli]